MDFNEYCVGLTHLWHMHQLANIRLKRGGGISDVPGVDFRSPQVVGLSQAGNIALVDRTRRRIINSEKQITRVNKGLCETICKVSDARYRTKRGLNNLPTEEEVANHLDSSKQLASLRRARLSRAQNISKENQILLNHLLNTKCTVVPTKELNLWYAMDHKKKLREMSRFKPSEPFSGANVLWDKRGMSSPGGSGCVKPRVVGEYPPLWGHRREPTVIEVLGRGPVLPSLQEAANQYVEGCGCYDKEKGFSCLTSRGKGEKTKRAKVEWKGISALDIKLLNYANDLKLLGGERFPFVHRGDENGVTSLWRGDIEKRIEWKRKKSARGGMEGISWRGMEGRGTRHGNRNISHASGGGGSLKNVMSQVRSLVLAKERRQQLAGGTADAVGAVRAAVSVVTPEGYPGPTEGVSARGTSDSHFPYTSQGHIPPARLLPTQDNGATGYPVGPVTSQPLMLEDRGDEGRAPVAYGFRGVSEIGNLRRRASTNAATPCA
uniref:Uncharacterized protein n=1 Tax=Trypanosoma congolense (strain IL3000) TaxID=1068625 RepID=G0URR1_TRYCI|nr:conserved hypothetical protein [Trypanosoma congolense IL3000]